MYRPKLEQKDISVNESISKTGTDTTVKDLNETEKKTGTDTKNMSVNETDSKTGTETKNFTVSENDIKTGTETKNFTIDETFSKSGRNVAGADLIQAEIEMRVKQIFFDIVYRDIDSVATIPLYI